MVEGKERGKGSGGTAKRGERERLQPVRREYVSDGREGKRGEGVEMVRGKAVSVGSEGERVGKRKEGTGGEGRGRGSGKKRVSVRL